MFNKKDSSTEILEMMEKNIISNAVDKTSSNINKFSVAINHLNDVAKSFDELGLISESEIITRFLETITKVAVDAESIRNNISSGIETALSNKGFIHQLTDFAKNYPDVYAIRLTINAKSNYMAPMTMVVGATMYDPPQSPDAANVLNIISNQIENYLNTNYELFPQKVDNETVNYNNFQFNIDVRI